MMCDYCVHHFNCKETNCDHPKECINCKHMGNESYCSNCYGDHVLFEEVKK